ncbi:unnamed protein product [Aureobasidium mustum]|uniref:Uncharacterized protein n=1 Tax=Aureobasidium mustum TaxID=2773714 RepID=A0A9N8K4C7_9PEZI|nr:unnamed protein product [Aureobasidium mustum]
MDESSLRDALQRMEKKLYQLTEILEDHKQSWERNSSVTFDPRPSLSLVEELRADVRQDGDIAAENASEMIHHIADKVIKDTIDHLPELMRSKSPESQSATDMIDQFFGCPEGDRRRKDIEHRLKKRFVWDQLSSWICGATFEYALSDYEYEVEKAALRYVADDLKELVATITGT